MADSAVEYVLLADALRLPLDAVKTPCVCKRHVTSCRSGAVAQRSQWTRTAAAWRTGHNVQRALPWRFATRYCRRTQAHFGASRDWSKRVHAYDAFEYGDVGVCANRRGCTRHARGTHAACTPYSVLSRDSMTRYYYPVVVPCHETLLSALVAQRTPVEQTLPSWVHVSSQEQARMHAVPSAPNSAGQTYVYVPV